METEETAVNEETTESQNDHPWIKALAGITAGVLASWVAEKGVDRFFARRHQTETTEETETE